MKKIAAVLKRQKTEKRKRISKKTGIDAPVNDTLEPGKIVHIQCASQKPENVPGMWRFVQVNPSLACGAQDYAEVECMKGDAPYFVGRIYCVATSRLSPVSWEIAKRG